jgi:hypothetical protein
VFITIPVDLPPIDHKAAERGEGSVLRRSSLDLISGIDPDRMGGMYVGGGIYISLLGRGYVYIYTYIHIYILCPG